MLTSMGLFGVMLAPADTAGIVALGNLTGAGWIEQTRRGDTCSPQGKRVASDHPPFLQIQFFVIDVTLLQ